MARRYVAQFYPPLEYLETKLELAIEGERFRASGRQAISDGWRALVASVPHDEENQDADQDGSTGALPALEEGERITCDEVTISEKQTTPPKRFTDVMLIEAMTGIARYVDDPLRGGSSGRRAHAGTLQGVLRSPADEPEADDEATARRRLAPKHPR